MGPTELVHFSLCLVACIRKCMKLKSFYSPVVLSYHSLEWKGKFGSASCPVWLKIPCIYKYPQHEFHCLITWVFLGLILKSIKVQDSSTWEGRQVFAVFSYLVCISVHACVYKLSLSYTHTNKVLGLYICVCACVNSLSHTHTNKVLGLYICVCVHM